MQVVWLTLRDVVARRRRSRSCVYRDIDAGLFVPPVRLAPATIRFPEHEIEAIDRVQLAGGDADAVRDVVQKLIAARKGGGE